MRRPGSSSAVDHYLAGASVFFPRLGASSFSASVFSLMDQYRGTGVEDTRQSLNGRQKLLGASQWQISEAVVASSNLCLYSDPV